MNNFLKLGIVLVIIGGAAWFWGAQYAQTHIASGVGNSIFGAFGSRPDPTYDIAIASAMLGFIGFLIGVVLLIVGGIIASRPTAPNNSYSAPIVSGFTDISSTAVGTTKFDQSKWNALVKYDTEIAAAAQKVQAFGAKWTDEFASSFMALNDKTYLPGIVEKIIALATAEQKEKEGVRAEAQERQRAYEREQERVAQQRKEWWQENRKKLLTISSVSVLLLIAAGATWWMLPQNVDKRVMQALMDKARAGTERYGGFKAELMKAGWSPFTVSNKSCASEICSQIPEALQCYGNQQFRCEYTWKRGQALLEVIGGSEADDQIVIQVKLCNSITETPPARRAINPLWECN